MRSREEQAAVEERQLGGDDDPLGARPRAPAAVHNPAAADLGRPGALVDPRPIGDRAPRRRPRGTRPGRTRPGRRSGPRRRPRTAGRSRWVNDAGSPAASAASTSASISPRRSGSSVYVKFGLRRRSQSIPSSAASASIPRDPPLVGLAVGASGLGAVGRGDRVVGEPVQGAQLRGRVAGDAGPDLAALEHGDVGAVALQLAARSRGRRSRPRSRPRRRSRSTASGGRRARSRSIAPGRDGAPGQSLDLRGRPPRVLPTRLAERRTAGAQASSRFSTLPVALRGSESRNSTSRGTL